MVASPHARGAGRALTMFVLSPPPPSLSLAGQFTRQLFHGVVFIPVALSLLPGAKIEASGSTGF